MTPGLSTLPSHRDDRDSGSGPGSPEASRRRAPFEQQMNMILKEVADTQRSLCFYIQQRLEDARRLDAELVSTRTENARLSTLGVGGLPGEAPEASPVAEQLHEAWRPPSQPMNTDSVKAWGTRASSGGGGAARQSRRRVSFQDHDLALEDGEEGGARTGFPQRIQNSLHSTFSKASRLSKQDRNVFADAEAMKARVRAAITAPKGRDDDPLRQSGCAQAVARSGWLEHATLIVVFLNSLWLAYETDNNKEDVLILANPEFQVAEQAFCAYFFLEWLG
eukprot:CAMPEP_0168357196 /NCGR_PEP_ID=MMETSP0228-20121227/461_1 /TAXON_ID=133427 /ORGANISM="Protoceratium reticulatum, Strain CCCM 535 (=CCMP 1889)" /LENGTH=277 /DNA_ID=CAMNT_0008369705 /DNA_START=15 /DNA_END=845 /DNA_ORIENTATION=+